jgi:hypothetical protein
MMLFGRSEALSERQIRQCERREERLRTKVRLQQEDLERVRRERNDLVREAAKLRTENREVNEQVKELQRQLQSHNKLQHEVPTTSANCPRLNPSPEFEDPAIVHPEGPSWYADGAMQQEAQPPLTSRGTKYTSSPCMPWTTSSGNFAASSTGAAGSMQTPRGLGMVTPRSGGVRGGMRGTVASVALGEACHVHWAEFTSRSTGMPYIFGERGGTDIEESTLSLRRGEYISSIAGIRSRPSSSDEPCLARSLRIVTSEQQEIFAGEPSTSWDFHFEADEGREIVGLIIQDGAVSGVKQAILAPSRAPSGIIAGPVAVAACAGRAAHVTSMVEVEASGQSSVLNRLQSMEALRRSSMARIQEAVY